MCSVCWHQISMLSSVLDLTASCGGRLKDHTGPDLNAHCVLSSVHRHISVPLTIRWRKRAYSPHFTGEETGASGGQAACPRLLSREAELGLRLPCGASEPRSSCLQAQYVSIFWELLKHKAIYLSRLQYTSAWSWGMTWLHHF